MTRIGDERRSQRYPTRTPCEVRFVEGSKLVGGTATFLDISVMGVQIECDFAVPIDTVMAIYLDSETNPIYAQVVRDATTPEGKTALGAKFIEGGIPYGVFTNIAFSPEQLCMNTKGLEIVCTLR